VPPPFYKTLRVLSTVDVIVSATSELPFGVLEADRRVSRAFTGYEDEFLTGFAKVLAEAVATAERADAYDTQSSA
jgi:hypothetical protein